MPRYLVEGRVIPERIDYNVPGIDLIQRNVDDSTLNIRISIIKSKIFVHLESEKPISYPDTRNRLFTIVGSLINLGGFQLVCGISYELDSITNVDERSTHVFGVQGHAFDDQGQFGDKLTFAPGQFGAALAISSKVLLSESVSRATFELRNSIRYPDFTALHCRLAIETIRNAFNSEDEKDGWTRLRNALRVQRETIESFKEVATVQRHGKNVPQTWKQRQRCMQIAWEITHRFIRHLESDASLQDAPFL